MFGQIKSFFASRPTATPLVQSICIAMVRNEQDIIETFVRKNAPFFDLMFVFDNQSQDRTRDILMDCTREFDQLCVSDMRLGAYDQARLMTEALHFIQPVCGADFVAFLDADEIIDAPDRATFLRHLSKVPAGQFGRIGWRTIMPGPDADQTDPADWRSTVTWTRKQENPRYFKAILRAGGASCRDVTVDQGNHGFRDAAGQKLASVDIPGLALLHCPIRSADQALAKGIFGWQAHQKRTKTAKTEAYQWQRLHDLHVAGATTLQPAQLAQEAMEYAQKSVPDTWHDNAEPWTASLIVDLKYSDARPAALSDLLASGTPERTALTYQPRGPRKSSQASSSIAHAFDDDWHEVNFFLDIPPFHFILDKYRIGSCLDVGCGTGALIDFARHAGVSDIYGLDGIDLDVTTLDANTYGRADIEAGFNLGRRFDLVFCLEVIEHISPENTETVIDAMDRHAKDLIVFSMAEPGQPGNHHINCLPIDRVLDLWRARGWVPNLQETLAVRSLASLSWFRRNLVVLHKANEANTRADDTVLRRIGARRYRWYDQNSGIRQTAFDDVTIPDGKGYV